MKFRSYQKEYLDGDQIETKDLFRNLVELDIINKQLGGYNASLKGLQQLIKTNNKTKRKNSRSFTSLNLLKRLNCTCPNITRLYNHIP